MSQVGIVNEGIALSGEVNFGNVNDIENDLLELLHKSDKFVNIHLENVERCNSSLLALLMVILNFAHRKNITVKFHNIPVQLILMAKLSNLDNSLKS